MTKVENAARREAIIGYLKKLGGRHRNARSVARALLKQGVKMATPCDSHACPVAEGLRAFCMERWPNEFRYVSVGGGNNTIVRFKGPNGLVDTVGTSFDHLAHIDAFIGDFDAQDGTSNDDGLCRVSAVLR